jgi:uncharacterized protein YggE
MYTRILTFSLILLAAQDLSAQAAGNAIYAAPAAEMDYSAPKAKYRESSQSYYQPPVYPLATEANSVILNDSVIEIGIKGLMNVKADSYVAIFGVSQVSENIDSCNRLINERISSLTNRLQALGINKSDIYVDFVSQVPVFEYEVEKKLFSKKYNEIPKGFELKKNIHIAYKKGDALDDILLAAAKNEIYDVIKVDYIINNVEAVYDTLRSASIRSMNHKTEDLKKLGVKFNSKFTVVGEDSRCYYPIERYKSYTAFSNVSLSSIKKSANTSNVYQAPKTLSIYYDKLSYGNFEIVINPKVVEPCAQFTYSLKMRYTFKTETLPREKPGSPVLNTK